MNEGTIGVNNNDDPVVGYDRASFGIPTIAQTYSPVLIRSDKDLDCMSVLEDKFEMNTCYKKIRKLSPNLDTIMDFLTTRVEGTLDQTSQERALNQNLYQNNFVENTPNECSVQRQPHQSRMDLESNGVHNHQFCSKQCNPNYDNRPHQNSVLNSLHEQSVAVNGLSQLSNQNPCHPSPAPQSISFQTQGYSRPSDVFNQNFENGCSSNTSTLNNQTIPSQFSNSFSLQSQVDNAMIPQSVPNPRRPYSQTQYNQNVYTPNNSSSQMNTGYNSQIPSDYLANQHSFNQCNLNMRTPCSNCSRCSQNNSANPVDNMHLSHQSNSANNNAVMSTVSHGISNQSHFNTNVPFYNSNESSFTSPQGASGNNFVSNTVPQTNFNQQIFNSNRAVNSGSCSQNIMHSPSYMPKQQGNNLPVQSITKRSNIRRPSSRDSTSSAVSISIDAPFTSPQSVLTNPPVSNTDPRISNEELYTKRRAHYRNSVSSSPMNNPSVQQQHGQISSQGTSNIITTPSSNSTSASMSSPYNTLIQTSQTVCNTTITNTISQNVTDELCSNPKRPRYTNCASSQSMPSSQSGSVQDNNIFQPSSSCTKSPSSSVSDMTLPSPQSLSSPFHYQRPGNNAVTLTGNHQNTAGSVINQPAPSYQGVNNTYLQRDYIHPTESTSQFNLPSLSSPNYNNQHQNINQSSTNVNNFTLPNFASQFPNFPRIKTETMSDYENRSQTQMQNVPSSLSQGSWNHLSGTPYLPPPISSSRAQGGQSSLTINETSARLAQGVFQDPNTGRFATTATTRGRGRQPRGRRGGGGRVPRNYCPPRLPYDPNFPTGNAPSNMTIDNVNLQYGYISNNNDLPYNRNLTITPKAPRGRKRGSTNALTTERTLKALIKKQNGVLQAICSYMKKNPKCQIEVLKTYWIHIKTCNYWTTGIPCEHCPKICSAVSQLVRCQGENCENLDCEQLKRSVITSFNDPEFVRNFMSELGCNQEELNDLFVIKNK